MIDTDFLKKLGARVRKLRLMHGFTQEKLSKKTGLHYKFIGNLESGRVNISVLNLCTLSNALDMPISRLLDYETPIDLEQEVPDKSRLLKIMSAMSEADLLKTIKVMDILR